MSDRPLTPYERRTNLVNAIRRLQSRSLPALEWWRRWRAIVAAARRDAVCTEP